MSRDKKHLTVNVHTEVTEFGPHRLPMLHRYGICEFNIPKEYNGDFPVLLKDLEKDKPIELHLLWQQVHIVFPVAGGHQHIRIDAQPTLDNLSLLLPSSTSVRNLIKATRSGELMELTEFERKAIAPRVTLTQFINYFQNSLESTRTRLHNSVKDIIDLAVRKEESVSLDNLIRSHKETRDAITYVLTVLRFIQQQPDPSIDEGRVKIM